MAQSPGIHLGPYEVLAPMGAGGHAFAHSATTCELREVSPEPR